MLDIESMINARRVICLKKFLEDYPSTWKSFLNSCIFLAGGSLILHCNFDTIKLKTQFPKYYKECFDAWSGLNNSTPVTFNDVMNEIIGTIGSYVLIKSLSIEVIYLSVIVRENRAEPKDRGRPFTFIFSQYKGYPKRLTTMKFAEVGVRFSSRYHHIMILASQAV